MPAVANREDFHRDFQVQNLNVARPIGRGLSVSVSNLKRENQ
jgi:hypothetical protein